MQHREGAIANSRRWSTLITCYSFSGLGYQSDVSLDFGRFYGVLVFYGVLHNLENSNKWNRKFRIF